MKLPVSGTRTGTRRNKKHPVGKIDPDTGDAVYKPEYISRMAEAGTPLPARNATVLPETFTVSDIRKSTIRDFGHTYFLEQIARSIGLENILSESLPQILREIGTLATYLIRGQFNTAPFGALDSCNA
jgi:hypothetical protein